MIMPLRFFLPLLILVFASFIIMFSLGHQRHQAALEIEQRLMLNLQQEATRLQSTINYLLQKNDLDQIQEDISSMGTDPALLRTLLVNDQGRILASTQRADLGKPAAALLKSEWPRIQHQVATTNAVNVREDQDQLTAVAPVSLATLPGEIRPKRSGMLIIQYDMHPEIAHARRAAEQQSLAFALFLSLCAVLFWLIVHFLFNRRTNTLIAVAQRLARGDFSARAAMRGRDELAEIGAAFDDMAQHMASQQQHLAESEKDLRAALVAAQMGSWQWDIASSHVHWSPQVEVLFGIPPGSFPGTLEAYAGYLHPDDRDMVQQAINSALEGHSEFRVEHRVRWPDHSVRWLCGRGEVVRDATGQATAMRGLVWDITPRKKSEAFLLDQQIIMEMIIRDASLQAILHKLAEVVEAQNGRAHCTILLTESDGQHLSVIAAPSLAKAYVNALRHVPIGPLSGSCGTAAYLGETVIVEDIASDPLWENYRYLTLEYGLQACWSMPIFDSRHRVLGTFAMYYSTPEAPSDEDQRLVASAVHLASFAIERKQSEDALHQEKERAQVTLHSIADGVITTDDKGQISYLNQVAELLTGWSTQEAQGKHLNEVFYTIDDHTRQVLDNSVPYFSDANGGYAAVSKTLINRKGQEIAIEDSTSPLRNRDGHITGVAIVFHDVRETRAMAHKLSWQASHDALTGLFNRYEFERHLTDAIEHALDTGTPYTLLYFDLDQFKVVNDTCGHVAGDNLLKQLSSILQAQVQETSTLARLGGDEFGLLLQNQGADKAYQIADKLRQVIKKFRFVWEQKSFEIGASIGLVNIDAQTQGASEILSAADLACYSAKEQGRNRIHVYQPEDSDLTQRQSQMLWVSHITEALKENRFLLYNQAIVPVNPASSTEIHSEILIRLQQADGNIVAPGAFIPAAERYDLMPAIDRWVIDTLFRHIGTQRRTQPNAPHEMFSVNLSGTSIGDDDFLAFIRAQLQRYHVPPACICFEITETAAIANLDKANRLIKPLKAIGCRFSLDDFGSGLSSFTYLKNLPVDFLKIDGSFVKDMVDDPIDCAMVGAINQIGHVMKIQTIAEFVENEAILQKLRDIGVDYAQGYGIEKPKPLELANAKRLRRQQ